MIQQKMTFLPWKKENQACGACWLISARVLGGNVNKKEKNVSTLNPEVGSYK